ncbi:GntR family transcriptional regulator [Sphingosinicella rhizophila]|uniref:GntR family transcriptional regulator n=1 Tax=Sphingosinicella rhizophila TaxID=3050082 RepID=A0ABU3QAA8_9SPHN|nr:GntR family transcriptional regulator [Sphingosinicella sp. GR2756]MDT9600351.1 GntR family transcriptional regulator [Sphingosinicella sp. GR2756]
MSKSAESKADQTPEERPARMLNLVQRDTLKTRIYREVRNALLGGHFDPGEAITVRRLAEELGAGAMPIRESLQRLVAEGALMNLPNGRVQVPRLTADEFDEIKEIRLRLEGFASARAAVRRTDKDLELISLNHDKLMGLLTGQGEWSKITEANRAFHFSIYQASGAHHLLSLIDSLWLRVGPLLAFPFKVPMEARAAYVANLGRHSDLMTSVKDGDGRAAEAAIREILLASAAWYHRHYQFSA